MNELAIEVRDMLWDQLKTEVNISYILKDSTGHIRLVAYEKDNEENIIGASGRLERGFITFSIPDWDFNVDDYLLKDLEEGYQIAFMPIMEHYNIWCAIDDFHDEIQNKRGLQEYLGYCQKNDITPSLIQSIGQQRINVMKFYHEENQGYQIIADYAINKAAYVIGYNPKAPSPYAVWRTNANRSKGYDIGHYFDNFDEAFSDFKERIQDEVDKQVYLKRKSFKREERSNEAR